MENYDSPVLSVKKHVIAETTSYFDKNFNGTTLYAVKCNPTMEVLLSIWNGGVQHFDCASLNEIKLVRKILPEAHIHFMHPVKSRSSIKESWLMGIRDFVIDSQSEIEKIAQEIENYDNLGIFVRIQVPDSGATINLSKKFGASEQESIVLLRNVKKIAKRVGISFHVGSQCMDENAWANGVKIAENIINQSGVDIDIIDIGGGFPIEYPGMKVPNLLDIFNKIESSKNIPLWAEPGRFLVATGESVIVKVLMRRGDCLYINDGVYGNLSDAGQLLNYRFPCKMLRKSQMPNKNFSFYGPTCDSLDFMKGPFELPEDIQEGDLIEINNIGAYGSALKTNFNGF